MQVTGLKSTVHTEASLLPSHGQPMPQGPQLQEARKPRQEMEDREAVPQRETERVREEVKKEEEEEAAPAGLYSDWTRGSVRRVTRQLEQRMKQEQETPSLSSSPPSVSGSSQCSLRRPASVHLTTASGPQDASVCLQVSVVGSVQEESEGDGSVENVKSEGVVKMRAPGSTDESTKASKPADCRPLSTSSFHRSALSPFASVNFLCLEGVTELESGTDWDCPSEGPHSEIILKETWETLCELGAFLQQVSAGGAFRARGGDLKANQKRGGSSVHKRVSEVEARIRQAGLTPPSLMKRSASLAKLGCLELLANELSEWELSRSSVAPRSAEPLAVNDESKKQRVQSSPSSDGQPTDTQAAAADRLSEAGRTSPLPPAPSSSENPQAGKPPNSDPESLFPGPSLKAMRQQYSRTHPLRRLKKRTTSTLYHTM